MEPITRSEQIMSAISGEYDGTIPTPITRGEKILAAIYNRIGGAGGSASPETVGQAMKEYVEQNPEFWDNIPGGTITREMLADDVPEQIRDETLREMSAEEVKQILDGVFHNN